MLRFSRLTVLTVLAFFVASTLASALPALFGDVHTAGQVGASALALTAAPDADLEGAPDDEGAKCTHACHLMQHLQASVDQPWPHSLDRRGASYPVAEHPTPPQFHLEASLRPPRVPAASV